MENLPIHQTSSAPSATPAAAPTSQVFLNVAAFPVELRLKIWRATLTPQTWEFVIRDDTCRDAGWNLVTLKRPANEIVALRLCKESREEALRKYRKNLSPFPLRIPFDPITDTVLITLDDTPGRTARAEAQQSGLKTSIISFYFPIDWSFVQFLVLERSVLTAFTDRPCAIDYPFYEFSFMMDLKEVGVVFKRREEVQAGQQVRSWQRAHIGLVDAADEAAINDVESIVEYHVDNERILRMLPYREGLPFKARALNFRN